jgi:predicted DNA-binding transcriptional regulator AlpA
MTLNPSQNSDKLLRTEDLAQRWGLSPDTLKNWRSAGRGPNFIKLGSACRYRLADIVEFERANHENLDVLQRGAQ